MNYYYRRNADEEDRDLERRFHAGDITLLPQLVAHKVRTDTLTVSFMLQFPQAFHYLPQNMQEALANMGHAPLQQSLTEDGYCQTCTIPDHSTFEVAKRERRCKGNHDIYPGEQHLAVYLGGQKQLRGFYTGKLLSALCRSLLEGNAG